MLDEGSGQGWVDPPPLHPRVMLPVPHPRPPVVGRAPGCSAGTPALLLLTSRCFGREGRLTQGRAEEVGFYILTLTCFQSSLMHLGGDNSDTAKLHYSIRLISTALENINSTFTHLKLLLIPKKEI